MFLTYHKSDLVEKTWIRLNAPEEMSERDVIVQSGSTGVKKLFIFDELRTEMLAVRHEWWDGEENHRIYNDSEGLGITLELWSSPNV